MDEYQDSDINPAMLASNAFENIINQICTSNLNFQLQMSPFSACISLKRSLVKEKSGAYRLPPASESPSSESKIAALLKKNLQLENNLVEINKKYDRAVDDCLNVTLKLEEHKKNNIKKEPDDEKLIEGLENDLNSVIVENKKYRDVVREQEEEIGDLRRTVKVKEEIANNLNKQIRDLKLKVEKENVLANKRNKAELKLWKKELGEERKEKIKLEKKLDKLVSEKEIDKAEKKKEKARPIVYSERMPDTACENCDDASKNEKSDPEHLECIHEQQCVMRQPFPPPSPSSPFLEHDVSKYHIHMMTKTPDELTGCIGCFSVDNENYGCDKCTWLKWWYKWHGDRHGLPDIHPSVYRNYQ